MQAINTSIIGVVEPVFPQGDVVTEIGECGFSRATLSYMGEDWIIKKKTQAIEQFSKKGQ
jgi:hypothetical protein